MKLFFYIVLAFSAFSAWSLSLTTFYLAQSILASGLMLIGLPLLITLLVTRFSRSHKKLCYWLFIGVLFINTVALLYNHYSYEKFTQHYISGDSAFDIAARNLMPKLEDINGKGEVEHYHGISADRRWEEWVFLKVTTDRSNFDELVCENQDKYNFYESEIITNEAFCDSKSCFVAEDYEFRVVNCDLYKGGPAEKVYAAVIGTSASKCSIIYTFICSESLRSMPLEAFFDSSWWSNVGIIHE